MLTQLRIQNFRCFRDHTLPVRPCAIVVGKNNAGKSTLVEALRIVSISSSRFLKLGIVEPPDWGGIPRREVGVSPSIEGMGFNTSNTFYRYGREPAVITASFSSGGKLKTYVGAKGQLHAVLFDSSGNVVRTRASAIESNALTRVETMPQVGPIELTEVVLRPDYVRRNVSSNLSSRHFRNQLLILQEHWTTFRRLAEDTWPSLRVEELSRNRERGDVYLSLLVRNDDFVAEVATMGHGLQMWLQTMWFLARADVDATIILDEPDVYMHPDLQRRLVRYLRKDRRQVLVTTHSVEIMSEVSPEDILVLDRQHPKSKYAASFPAAQRLLDSVGSAHNLQLARLWHARRALFVEGDDLRILAIIYDQLVPDDRDGLASIPHLPVGGWGGWQYAIGSSMLLQNAGGADIAVYCILDSDYHTSQQKDVRREQAAAKNVRLHIWQQKEIENYLLVPTAIARAIEANIDDRTMAPTVEDIRAFLDRAAEECRNEAFDAYATEFLSDDRTLGPGRANQLAREYVDRNWGNLEGKLAIVSGKAVLARLAAWSHDTFHVSLNATRLASSLRVAEVANEMRHVLRSIATGSAF